MSSASIPLYNYVSVNTGTISSGAVGVTLAALALTKAQYTIPFDTTGGLVQTFTNLAAVQDYFGIGSNEDIAAARYFLSYKNSLTIPPYMLFARYTEEAEAPWIKTAQVAGGIALATWLAQIKAVTAGAITFVFDSEDVPLTGLDFSAATSLDDVADILQTALIVALTGAATVAFQTYSGSVNPIGAFIASNGLTTGTDTVGFCAVSDLATLLGFTEAGAAVLSQGTLALTAAQNMNAIINITTDWENFYHLWDTSEDVDYATDLALSSWATDTNKYMFCLWSLENNLGIPGNEDNIATVIDNANASKTIITFGNITHNSFLTSIGASVNYSEANSRLTVDYKTQEGLLPSVTDLTFAQALEAKGVNYYGKVSNSSNKWNFYFNGKAFDPLNFVANAWDQRWLANAIANASIELLLTLGSLPYDQPGYSTLHAALMSGPAQAGLKNKVIQKGNSFTLSQVAQLKQESGGINIAPNITQSGYYIQVVPATAQQRIDRDAVIVNFWYTNGGSIMRITTNLVFVQ